MTKKETTGSPAGTLTIRPIGHIHTDFPEKFGIPRQSGLVPSLQAYITFEKEFQNPDCFRDIERFTHLWLIWGFSENQDKGWSPTVRPPRLGGNVRMGVFATRSPFRPNPLGLSSVRLLGVEDSPEGKTLRIAGADLMDGTPILDIKPYLPFTDSHPDAKGGFSDQVAGDKLAVETAPGLSDKLPSEKWKALLHILAQDPRPSYQDDPGRVYGMAFAGKEVYFTVDGKTARLVDIQ